MLMAWKGMHPAQHYVGKYFDLYNRLLQNQNTAIESAAHFAAWYEHTIDLPGKFYLDVVDQLFKRNLLFRGEFIALGRQISLGDITCPVYLLAGAADDITPPEQVFDASRVLLHSIDVTSALSPGGHIGLFMGSNTLRDLWPQIVRWDLGCN
jgi:poly(3-hydroxyalkanoate) synthetase